MKNASPAKALRTDNFLSLKKTLRINNFLSLKKTLRISGFAKAALLSVLKRIALLLLAVNTRGRIYVT